MKNYAVLEGMKRHQKTVLDDAFNKGYDQGYHDGKLDGKAEKIEELEKKFDDDKKAEYKRGYADGKKEVAAELNFEKGYYKGYEDGKTDIVSKAKAEVSQYREGYDKGLKHGRELRAEEVKCAEACGMKRAWQAVRKIMYMSLYDLDELFPGWDVEHIIEKLSAKEVIEKIEAWENKKEGQRQSDKVDCKNMDCKNCINHNDCDYEDEKQEETEKNCDNCKHNNVASGIDGTCYECVKGVQDNYEEEQTEKNCDNCKYNNREKTAFPCSACITMMNGFTMWEEKKDYVRDATPEESKSVNDYIKSISKETGVTFGEKEEKTEKNCDTCNNFSNVKPFEGCTLKECHYEPKQEQTKKTCDTCEHGEAYKQGSDITTMDDECGGCCSWNSKWTPKEDTIGNSVKSIGFGDEVVDNLGHVMMVTYIAVESKCADVLKSDGTTDQMPLEILEKTGKHYDIQALLDAMKSEKTEEGGE